MNKEEWQRVKNLVPATYPLVEDFSGKNIGLSLGKIHPIQRIKIAADNKKAKHDIGLSQHERIVIGRAAKLGLTMAEYKEKFGG